MHSTGNAPSGDRHLGAHRRAHRRSRASPSRTTPTPFRQSSPGDRSGGDVLSVAPHVRPISVGEHRAPRNVVARRTRDPADLGRRAVDRPRTGPRAGPRRKRPRRAHRTGLQGKRGESVDRRCPSTPVGPRTRGRQHLPAGGLNPSDRPSPVDGRSGPRSRRSRRRSRPGDLGTQEKPRASCFRARSTLTAAATTSDRSGSSSPVWICTT